MEDGEERGMRKERGEKGEERGERRPIFSLFSFLFSLLSLLFFLFSSPSFANPAKPPPKISPMEAVKGLDQLAEQYRVGKNLTPKDREFNQQLKQKILRGTFNLHELAKLALAKYWQERSPKEQTAFVELLTQLLEERSVFAKEQAEGKGEGKSYQIDYKNEKYLNKEKTTALVHTVVRLTKHRTKLDLDYQLKRALNGEWQIFDVIVDEASLVANYRSSFGNIIKKQGYAELVRRMENKLKEFRAKKA